MTNLVFAITNDVLDLEIKVLTAKVVGVKNSNSNDEFEKFLHEELQGIKKFWKDKDYKEGKILQGFRDLHKKVGRSNRKLTLLLFPLNKARGYFVPTKKTACQGRKFDLLITPSFG